MILTSIKSFFVSQKLLFVIFILLQIFAVVSTQYAFLDIIKKENDRIIYVEEATLFIVDFNESTSITDINSKIDKIVSDYSKKLTAISIDSTTDNLRAYFFGQNKVVNYGSSNFDVNDIIVSTNQEISGNVELGEKFCSAIGEFNVTGLRIDAPYNEILLSAVNDSFEINSLNITLSFLPSISQKDNFSKYLQSIFPNANIVEPVNRNMHNEALFSSKIQLTISLLALTAINIIYIFRYVIYKRQKTYIISRLCGATKKHIFIVTFLEYMIYSVVSSCVATLLTVFIIIPIFYESVYFTLSSIILPVLLFFIICICIILPLLIKNSNLRMLQNKVVN